MRTRWRHLIFGLIGTVYLGTFQGCSRNRSDDTHGQTTLSRSPADSATMSCCPGQPPTRLASVTPAAKVTENKGGDHAGMVRIPAGRYAMGADQQQGRPDEYPKHTVQVDSFWMDATEVTNAQFARFVAATGYVTTAERKPDWEELRQQLPPGTPRPDEKLLVASSLVFKAPPQAVSLADYSQWWQWVAGANWRHPDGPGSSIAGKAAYPVVQVSWDDAQAYATWAGKRLPTEAEWEWAGRGGRPNALYPWGNEPVEAGTPKANSWQGQFPNRNTRWDGFYGAAPVKSFAPNGYGLYDMAGNVWEWCADWYGADYYQTQPQGSTNPKGPAQPNDPQDPTVPKRVQRGGSFLCNDSYCSSYRSSARMKASPDTGLSHTGFRCVQ